MKYLSAIALLLAGPAWAADYTAAGCPDVPVEALAAPDIEYHPGHTAGGWHAAAPDMAPPVLTEEDIGAVDIIPELPLTNYVDGGRRGQFDPSRTGVYPGTITQDLRSGETYWNARRIAPQPVPPCPPPASSQRFDYWTGD